MSATDAIPQGITAGITFIVICWIIGIAIIVGLAALITWVVKKIWNAGKEPKKPAGERYDSSDWLSKAQQRQNKRYEYTDPASRPRPQKGAQKRENEPNWYPSGWTYNEDTQLWEPPDYIRNESNDKWKWDPEKKIWIDTEKQRRIDRYHEFRAKEGMPPTYEEWKAEREAAQQAEQTE